jgi:phosphatidylglycerol lysyltransferase
MPFRSRALIPARPLGRLILRQALPLFATAFCAVLFARAFAGVDKARVAEAAAAIPAWNWALALACVAASYWAAGSYDVLVHRALRTGRGESEARRAGLCAIALSQMTGFGLLTGTLARLRLLPGATFAEALRLTLAVSALFLVGWAWAASFLLLVFPAPVFPEPGVFAAPALAVALGLPLIGVAAAFLPRPRLFGRSLALPPLPVFLRLLALAALDTAAAGLALAMLMPPGAQIGVAALLPAFALAFGAGLISGAPFGLGAFEAALMALLAFAPAEPLLAGILAWRIAYFALPALLALPVLARGPGAADSARVPKILEAGPVLSPDLEGLLAVSRAEAGLLRQGDKFFLRAGEGGAVVARAPNTLAAIGAALGRTGDRAMRRALEAAARSEGRVPCLYKIGARAAREAREAGWAVLPVAREVWLAPARFDPASPARRQLRRKLRKAEAAGLRMSYGGPLPLAAMAGTARAWAEARGGENGVSMGRFAEGYVRAQRVYLAWQGDRLAGFVTFHEAQGERALDLVRLCPEAPEGTAHLLLAAAIAEAAEDGIARLSLAAIPDPALERLAGWLPPPLRPRGRDGLARFKRAFSDRDERLYIAAPSWPALALAGLDLARAIARPPALSGEKGGADVSGEPALPRALVG